MPKSLSLKIIVVSQPYTLIKLTFVTALFHFLSLPSPVYEQSQREVVDELEAAQDAEAHTETHNATKRS